MSSSAPKWRRRFWEGGAVAASVALSFWLHQKVSPPSDSTAKKHRALVQVEKAPSRSSVESGAAAPGVTSSQSEDSSFPGASLAAKESRTEEEVATGIRRFSQLRRKVVQSVDEAAEASSLLRDRDLRARALRTLATSNDESEHFEAVAYLATGMQSGDEEIQMEFIMEAAPFITTVDLDEGPAEARRLRAGDVIELTVSYLVARPQDLGSLIERAKPTNRLVIGRAADYVDSTRRDVASMRQRHGDD